MTGSMEAGIHRERYGRESWRQRDCAVAETLDRLSNIFGCSVCAYVSTDMRPTEKQTDNTVSTTLSACHQRLMLGR